MNGASKLGRKSSEEAVAMKAAERKKRPSPRNPLKELNSGGSIPPPSGFSEALRGGCFGFLLPNSSTKESLPRSKSLHGTPKSAPPNPRSLPSKNSTNPSSSRYRGSGIAHKNGSKPSLEAPKLLGSKKTTKPRTPDLLQRWNRRKPKPNSEKLVGGKNSLPELSFDVGFGRNGGSQSELGSGPCLASTPEKPLPGFTPEIGFESKEGEPKVSNTPTSATTPPIQASISPEIACGSSVAPTPACFAAGYVVAGVQDRRKCRPRGILTIGGGGLEAVEDLGSRVSLLAPPLAGASIHWHSPPPENLNSAASERLSSRSRACLMDCPAEASVNWLLSPCADVEESVPKEGLPASMTLAMGTNCSTSYVLLGNLNPSPIERTPSSGNAFERTPSGSSVSPFSMILERVAASSKCKPIRSHQGRSGYRYGSALENSPFSDDSWVDSNVVSTPSSDSASKSQVKSAFEMNSMAVDDLGTVRLSPEPAVSDASYLSPLPGLSFQFGCPATASDSIDFSSFKEPLCDGISARKEFFLKNEELACSKTRISWREGLISRIFEMGELDCCQWLSDDEDEDIDCEKENVVESMFEKIGSVNKSSILKDGDDQLISTGFGSFEFPCQKDGVQKRETNIPPSVPISSAESISTEGVELVSSSDSDWTLLYKNHLFERGDAPGRHISRVVDLLSNSLPHYFVLHAM